MFAMFSHLFNLGRAGFVLARSALVSEDMLAAMPAGPRTLLKSVRIGAANRPAGNLVATITALGPSHIKLGQFLATRPDIIGAEIATRLSELQDRLAPFAQSDALAEIERGLGAPVAELFEEIGEPVAAASIAQVHKARVKDGGGALRDVAVKVLRPNIERRFAKDMDRFRFAAAMIEAWSKSARRLRPKAAVETLARSIEIEMDLRLEAAAILEIADNTAEDEGFTVPVVDWARTSRRVLTLEWVDGIPISDIAALKHAGHDLPALAATLIQSFLRQAMRDGFFHADMHPGNLFVNQAGEIVAVDFGIMGRLEPKDRRFLAEILHGFITRNYKRVADVHFDAGYVPAAQSEELFAQALCAIGEPIMNKHAGDISMARLLAQLFQVTEQFDMQTQPQLLLLQKTMVVVEGVGRTLDPDLNMWTVAEPVVKDWMTQRLGPEGRIQDAARGAAALGRLVAGLPETVNKFERVVTALEKLPEADHAANRNNKRQMAALWIGAGALCLIALAMLF